MHELQTHAGGVPGEKSPSTAVHAVRFRWCGVLKGTESRSKVTVRHGLRGQKWGGGQGFQGQHNKTVIQDRGGHMILHVC